MATHTLREHPQHVPIAGPLIVVVMDGVGIGRCDRGDAVWLANTPTLDRLARGPSLRLRAHGLAVGLPSDSDMGNSEVGHNIIGAGRVFPQGATLVEQGLDSGRLFAESCWQWLVEPVVQSSAALHFIGLLSDGNVHSHQRHLHRLLRQAAGEGVKRAYVHVLLDGRDVPMTSAIDYLRSLEEQLSSLRAEGADFRIASGGGRMVTTMDRYGADWSVVERGWQAHVLGNARTFASAEEAVLSYREEQPGLGDQYLPSFVVTESSSGEPRPVATIEDGDSVVFFNFRGDRALEISQAFVSDDFSHFDRVRRPAVRFAGMMQYDGDLQMPPRFLVQPSVIDNTLGELLAAAGVPQFACAETQKFGHVTYFWNGNRSGMFDPQFEEYVEVPSDVVPFDQRPEMKAHEVTAEVLRALRREEPPRFLRVNYANGDMVGHTGNLEASVRAVECVDRVLGELLAELESRDGVALVTADHGNADQMLRLDSSSGAYLDEPLTSHTLNPVPLYLFDPAGGRQLIETDEASLGNLASTVLELLGYEAPADYLPSLLA
jgi:2,3-bisphosphoglycerate-independent phosphoglycerate mutase